MKKIYTFLLIIASAVASAQIIAKDDYITAGGCSGGGFGNIFYDNNYGEDTLNGNPATIENVSITVIANQYPWIYLDTTSGNINVYDGSPAGFYTVTYQICEIANPTNCDIAYASVFVYAGVIDAVDDDFSPTPIDSDIGGSTSSVLANDTFCGIPVGSFSVTLTSYNIPSGLTLNMDGTITVAQGTVPGTYIVQYQICEILNPTNCDTANAFVQVNGNSTLVANYDDFSAPNYPNTTTASILNNDTLNGNAVSSSQVIITTLYTYPGFTINTNGTITIANVPEGTYFIGYQICEAGNTSNCSVNYAYVVVLKNRILGKVKFDNENDGCDTNDSYLNSIYVKNVNGSDTYTSYTANYFNNQYYLIGDSGTNTVSVQLPNYFTVTPANQVFNLSTPGTITASDFCVTSNASVDDLEIVLIPTRNVIPGLPVLYDIWYKNNGSTTLSGQITMQYDNTKMTFLSSNVSPNSTTSNTLTFNYSTLAPFESRMIRAVKFQVMTPPTVDIGTNATFTGNILPNATDATPTNNTSSITQIAVNSQDPNDIVVHEGSDISLAQAQNEYLHYTIRFQNIGTSEAINVKVVNELYNKLDGNTFELISASHNCRVKNKNNNLEFLFENINLPGSNNEPLSHGYITYKIKPISTIALLDAIFNEANIFFDYNLPILTNYVVTTVSSLSNQENKFIHLNYFPNPVKNSLTISNESSIDSVEITSLLGQTMLLQKVNSLQTEIDLSELSTGIYFVKVISEGQEKTVKIVKE